MTSASTRHPFEAPPLRFDVIVCTNRVTPYLRIALDSVRAQSYPHWTLTVVDDGSDALDLLQAIVSEVAGSRVIHQANKGLPAARNTAIRETSSAVLTFLDEDDVWPAERLEQLARQLERYPASSAAFGDGQYIDSGGDVFGEWVTPQGSRTEYLDGSLPLPRITTLAMRRAAVEEAGPFDEGFSLAEDIEFILRLARTGEMTGTGTHLVQYRRHERNMTNASPTELYDSAIQAVDQSIACAEAQGAHDDVLLLRAYRRREQQRWAADGLVRASRAWRSGERRAALADGLGALRLAPWAFVRGAAETVRSRMARRGAGAGAGADADD